MIRPGLAGFLALLVFGNLSCGVQTPSFSGGIVDNGHHPEDRERKESTESSDASPGAAPLVAFAIFDGRFALYLPSKASWTKNEELSGNGMETWVGRPDAQVTFQWQMGIPVPRCEGGVERSSTSGSVVIVCDLSRGIVRTRSGEEILIRHNLSVEQFDVIAMSLKDAR